VRLQYCFESVLSGFVTDRSIIAALEAAVHRVLDHLGAELADLGLRQAEINVLAQLRPGVPRPVGELVAATGQRPSTLTGVLDRLERKRLVRRRVNAADRRSFTIELTTSGEAAAARVHDAFAALDARVRDDLPPAATDGFHHVLDTLERHTRGTTA
jgi:DNA-binding MarR family transcriptional regulator